MYLTRLNPLESEWTLMILLGYLYIEANITNVVVLEVTYSGTARLGPLATDSGGCDEDL